MNWTEGNLARHSRGRQRNQLLVRQKQHFAKARSNLINGGAKQSPIAISFLGTEHIGGLRSRDTSSKVSSRQHTSPLQNGHRHRNPEERLHPKTESMPPLNGCAHVSDAGHREGRLLPEAVQPPQGHKRLLDSQSSGVDKDQSSLLQEKRRKLLSKADWVGISIQQPLDLAFPGQRNRHDNSRWSKAIEDQTRRPNNLRRLIDVNGTDGNMQMSYPKTRTVVRRDRRLPLRIQIGSQEIQPSIATSSQTSRKRLVTASHTSRSSSPLGSNPAPSEAHELDSYPGNHKMAKRMSALPPTDSSKSSVLRHKVDTHRNPVKATTRGEARLPRVVCSSSSVIHEPIPRRADRFRVLQWSPSKSKKTEREESLEVQVGRHEPSVTASQTAENEAWRNLVASSHRSEESMTQISSHDASLIKLAISPGVSVLPSHLGHELPSLGSLLETSSLKLSPSVGESHGSAEEVSLVHPPEESASSLELSIHPRGSPASQDTFPGVGSTPMAGVQEPSNTPPNTQTDHGKAKTTGTDEEQAWVKFVFDSDSDELREKAFKDAVHQDVRELKPADTSDNTDNFSLVINNSAEELISHTFPSSDAQESEAAATCGTVDSACAKVSDKTSSPRASDESHVATQGTILSDLNEEPITITAHHTKASPPYQRLTGAGFRFAVPKTFVGKLASSRNSTRPQSLMAPQYATTRSRPKGKGRRKKRALDGRPSIRDLPNYDDDPIEEL